MALVRVAVVMPGVLVLLGRLLDNRRLGGARCTIATETCPTSTSSAGD
jgi:hypothetical protein